MANSIEKLLEPVAGYLALGMWIEANDELEKLPQELKHHPKVLLARLELLVLLEKWEEGVMLGESLSVLWPDQSYFFFHTAYCFHELKRTSEAVEVLLKAPEAFRATAPCLYNLACYKAQLRELSEAKRLLDQCFKKDKGFRRPALEDSDLEPLWTSVSES